MTKIRNYYVAVNNMSDKNELLLLDRCIQALKATYRDEIDIDLKLIHENSEDIFIDKAQIVMFCIDSYNTSVSIKKATILKNDFPNTIIVFSGGIFEVKGKELMTKYECIDYIAYGPCDISYINLIDTIIQHKCIKDCPNIYYRSCNGEVLFNGDYEVNESLDRLPMPGRLIFNQNKVDFMSIITHEGCRGNCSFCNNTVYKVKYCRCFSILKIVDEMEYCIKNFNINKFYFVDASILDYGSDGLERVEQLFSEIISRSLSVYVWYYIRAEQINDDTIEILKKGKKAGFVFAFVGLESMNPDDLKLYRKIATVEENSKAVQILTRENIHFGIGFLPFNAYSTCAKLKKNLDFLYDISYLSNMDKFIGEPVLYVGSNLFNIYEREGLIKDYEFPNGYAFGHVIDEPARKLYENLIGVCEKEGVHPEEIDGDLRWIMARLDNMENIPAALRDYILIIKDELKILNEHNYIFLSKCLELAEKKEYGLLSDCCKNYSFESVYSNIRNIYLKLKKLLIRNKIF